MRKSRDRGREAMNEARGEAREAATASPMKILARIGYAAKGVVYLIIGGLAAKVAFGAAGGSTTDRNGALRAIHEQPFGRLLLAIVAVGLVGFALWSFIQAVFDPENQGTDAKGLTSRIGYAAVGISYAALALAAIQLVIGTGNGGQSSNTTTRDWTAHLLTLPFGPFLVVLVGVIVIGLGGYLFYRVFTADFKKNFGPGQAGSGSRSWIIPLGRAGFAALGVVFGIVGAFLIVAAVRNNAAQSKGLGGALQQLSREPYGHVLLAVVAIGLIAYGLYSFAEARYRRLERGAAGGA